MNDTVRRIAGMALAPLRFVRSQKPNAAHAVFRVKKILLEFVYDAAALEGNAFTYPEVQTLLDGVTVGGRALADQDQVLNQAASWRTLLALVESGDFAFDKRTACRLQALAARGEAMEPGAFRTGAVRVGGTRHSPPAADRLDCIWSSQSAKIEAVRDPHARAMLAFLWIARNQFFGDGNKRTGRLMMNGLLLSNGCEGITVAAARRHEFNARLVAFHDSGDATDMMRFLAECSLDRTLGTEVARTRRE